MVQELKTAAWNGDAEFVRRAVAAEPTEYFLQDTRIFVYALWSGKAKFLKDVIEMENLPTEVKKVLIFVKGDQNLLHLAAGMGDNSGLDAVQAILDFCKAYTGPPFPDDKPWLALMENNETPLHVAIRCRNEEVALELLSLDMELLCSMVDEAGNSPLFLALQKGCNQVAMKILMSSCSYSLIREDGLNLLHLATDPSENVLRLILKKHPELIDGVDDKGYNVLHRWAKMKDVQALDLLSKGDFPAVTSKVFTDFIYKTTSKKRGDSPLHIAARNKNSDVMRALINGYNVYKQEMEKGGVTLDIVNRPPWNIENNDGDTPLIVALYHKNEEVALYLLSLDSTLCQIHGNKGFSPLLAAALNGCGQVVEEILRTQDVCFSMLRSNDGTTILHYLQHIPEKIGRKLLEKFWWIINLPDDQGRTALDEAKAANIPWLVALLMKPSLIEKEPFDWVTACEKDDITAVLAFIDHCEDLQQVWREKKDTPLHHIKSLSYKEYVKLLKNPSIAELKNTIDFEGATPLHRALEREDMHLVKALLVDDGVERNIEDYQGRTAMSMLAKLYKEKTDWEMMCNHIKVNPNLKTTYIQRGTNLDQMRNTLSVVAALLATITFAAGFTLPGGLNSETGNAIMAKKVAFLVFLLADAYAMCTSILVLFCLIWSMVSNRDMSYLLVDRSVLILMQALYGTMVAFMTGIYAMVARNSLWAAIIIFVMCSFIGISANRTVLHNVLAKLVPTANQDQKDRAQFLEEGKSVPSKHSRNQVLEDQNPLLEEGKKAEEATTIPLRKSKSFLKQKTLIPSRNQDHRDQLPLLDEENEESHIFEGRNRKPLQNSTSLVQVKNVIPEENEQDKEDQIRMLEEGRAFMSSNEETKASSEIKVISEV